MLVDGPEEAAGRQDGGGESGPIDEPLQLSADFLGIGALPAAEPDPFAGFTGAPADEPLAPEPQQEAPGA